MTMSASPSRKRREAESADNRFTEAALERHKREGMELAVRARWIALGVIAVMLPIIEPQWHVIYYEVLLACLALIGWAQRRVGRVGRSGPELVLMFCDLAILTFSLIVPNPFSPADWPLAMEYREGIFKYFLIFLAGATLAYSWRTLIAMGVWTTGLWLLSVLIVWAVSVENQALTEAVDAAFGADPQLATYLNPNNLLFHVRIQEVDAGF